MLRFGACASRRCLWASGLRLPQRELILYLPRDEDEAGVRLSFATESAQSAAAFSITGKPLSAYSIAGISNSESFTVPYFSSRVTQPSNAPGTVIGSMPLSGMVLIPFLVK